MSIAQTLREKLTAAMKARDRRTADTIRMIETKVMERRKAKDFRGEVDDDLYVAVIGAYKKSLSKALVDYEAAGDKGAEQVEQLRFEIDFCGQFLPELLSEDQVRELVRQAIDTLGVTDPKMAGRVIGTVMKQHKDQVDAGVVKRLVGEMLAPN